MSAPLGSGSPVQRCLVHVPRKFTRKLSARVNQVGDDSATATRECPPLKLRKGRFS
jgi:hypothetical protein